jgi:hypothetical protein
MEIGVSQTVVSSIGLVSRAPEQMFLRVPGLGMDPWMLC